MRTRAGQALVWLLKRFGLDKIVDAAFKAIASGVGRISDRRKAIRKSRDVRDGRWAPVVAEGRTRWVVYSGDEPIEIFPPIKGDLAKEMRPFNTDRLREPDDVASARFVEWSRQKLGRLGDDDKEPALAADTPEAEAVREGLARAGADDGQGAFDGLVGKLPELLDELTGAAAATVASHNGIPEKPGIYLFSEGPNPIYVGNTRNLRSRLRQHTSVASRENQAALAWRIALKEAAEAGHPVAGTRKDLEADVEFVEHFRTAKERVAAMNAQFVEIEDPVTRTIFEVYAAQVLGTDEFNSWETH